VTGQRHLVTIDSSTVACKFRQPTDDNGSGSNKSTDKLASVFMIWGQGVVVSCTKFHHQSYANHFHKYSAVTEATGTQVLLSKQWLPTLRAMEGFPWIVGETMQNDSHSLPTAVCPNTALWRMSTITWSRTCIGSTFLAYLQNHLVLLGGQLISFPDVCKTVLELRPTAKMFNPLNPELNPICWLLALLAHHFLHVSKIRDKSLTIRILMLYIYIYIYIWSTYSWCF
jgi:hypothetical protein